MRIDGEVIPREIWLRDCRNVVNNRSNDTRVHTPAVDNEIIDRAKRHGFLSCSEYKPTEGGAPDSEDTPQWREPVLQESAWRNLVIINDDQQMALCVIGRYPPIVSSRYTLLAANGMENQKEEKITDISLRDEIRGGEKTLLIDIGTRGKYTRPGWVVAALADRLAPDDEISLQVGVHPFRHCPRSTSGAIRTQKRQNTLCGALPLLRMELVWNFQLSHSRPPLRLGPSESRHTLSHSAPLSPPHSSRTPGTTHRRPLSLGTSPALPLSRSPALPPSRLHMTPLSVPLPPGHLSPTPGPSHIRPTFGPCRGVSVNFAVV